MSGNKIAEMMSKHKKGDYSSGASEFRSGMSQVFYDTLEFRKKLTGSEWADKYGYLPSGTGAVTGAITLYNYQREPLDVMCDSRHQYVTFMKAARVGFTRMCQLAASYFLTEDPTLVVIAQPTISDAERFAKREIEPLIRETPILAEKRRPLKKGSVQDSLTDIFLTNGATLSIKGAASDDAFRGYDARIMVSDELDADGWTMQGDKSQGDKLELFEKRGELFWNWKLIAGSTPLVEDTSRIQKRWLMSDQRHYFVPCPHCHEMQYLEWGGREIPYGIKFDRDCGGALTDVWYVCKHCGGIIDEGKKVWMDSRGVWKPTAKPKQKNHAGFYLWTGMSLNPNAAWPIIVQKWLDAQVDPETRVKPFYNLWLGRPYKQTFSGSIKSEILQARVEPYAAEVPSGVRFLTVGVDTQSSEGHDPRLEASVYGWGEGHESWLIGHWVFRGDPRHPYVWQDLEKLLLRQFVAADGRRHTIAAACIDTGGHNAPDVTNFCAPRAKRNIWAIKGASERMASPRAEIWPIKATTVKNNNTGVRSKVYVIGGHMARNFVYKNLSEQKPGPKYIHFPTSCPEGAVSLGDEFFKQLTAERLVKDKGIMIWDKPKVPREAGVCLVYAYAATEGLRSLGSKWSRTLERLEVKEEPKAHELKPSASPEPQQSPKPVPPKPDAPSVIPATQKKQKKPRIARSSFMS